MLIEKDPGLAELVPLLKARKLLVFAGSGVSIDPPSRLPDWNGLLKGFVEFARDEVAPLLPPADRIHDLLKNTDVEIARSPIRLATALRTRILDPSLSRRYDLNDKFHQWFAALFSGAQPNANHRAIVKASYPFVLTSNYDNLLERAATLEGFVELGARGFTYTQPDRVASAVYEESACIVHVHGRASDARIEQVVFTAEDYVQIRAANKAFSVVIQSLLLRFSALFVGYGASDPHLEDLLEELSHLFRGATGGARPRTFLVLLRGKASPVFVHYKNQFDTDVICLDDYSETPGFLDTLAKESPRV